VSDILALASPPSFSIAHISVSCI